jgi:hypothetical protein
LVVIKKKTGDEAVQVRFQPKFTGRIWKVLIYKNSIFVSAPLKRYEISFWNFIIKFIFMLNLKMSEKFLS